MNNKQIAALKYLISVAKDWKDLSKRIAWFLLDESKGLTVEVCLTLVEGRGYTKEQIKSAAYGVGEMINHFNDMLDLAGSGFALSHHYGDFNPRRRGDPLCNDGQFSGHGEGQVFNPRLLRKGMKLRYTFWLSKVYCSPRAKFVRVNRNMLEKINLDKPGLYS